MSDVPPLPSRIRFGRFELDRTSGELHRQGLKIKLQAKPCQVLEVLLERPGEVVTREELRARLWAADTFVDFEHGLNTAVRKLRRALGDSAENPQFVETLARRGYRFVAPVETPSPSVEVARETAPAIVAGDVPVAAMADTPVLVRRSRRAPWHWGALILAVLGGLSLYGLRRDPAEVTISPPRSVGVLPFRVLDEQGEKSELGLGLADSVIGRLSELPGLRVLPTSSILAHDGGRSDAQAAGRALKVDSVLVGTVRRATQGFRVAAQLVAVREPVADSSAMTFDLEERELARLADRVAERVAEALRIPAPPAWRRGAEKRRTRNPAAYEAYLLGRAYLVRYTREGTLAAVRSFEEATRLDPDDAPAHAGLALANAEIHLRFAPEGEVKEWGDRAKQAAARAQALDPTLAETHQALAAVYGKTEFEWDRTIEESRRALDLNPRLELPYSYLARAYYHLGLLEKAEEQARAALALEPENRTEPLRALAIAALLAGRAAEAVPHLEEVQRISGRSHSDSWLALALHYSGEPARAETQLEAMIQSSSASASARGRATLAGFLAARGDRLRAETLVRALVTGKYMDHHVAYGVGAALAQLGRARESVEWLRRAARTGFPCHPWYAHDPLLAPVKTRKEFEELLEELRRAHQLAWSRYVEGAR